ncbi:hypothetical protein [Rhizobium alvei]|uniref:Glycosyl transferase family 2 n=1 Tax=Rhizobium alvei TaxID=1132659 RepID=A0ABT8YGP9_9HYPH|nr:hypothetical protein [Rhizobium alvei]MDO6962454.1 hypothetical protein [Rhizobium alvei]
MAKLSILVPVTVRDEPPKTLLSLLAERPAPDIEILVAAEAETAERLDLAALGVIDSRIRIVTSPATLKTELALWSFAIEASRGDWLTLIRPADMIDTQLLAIADFVSGKLGLVDAIAWNALAISADAEPGRSSSVAIPTKFDLAELDKTEMLKAFYLWEGAGNLPKMPFGLYHGLLRREFCLSVDRSIRESGRQHDLPQWEWAARTVLMSEKLVFCSRPLSTIDGKTYRVPPTYMTRGDFPFHGGIGITAALAEIQFSVFAEMGALWSGSQENFVRACVYDCMTESDPQRFNDRCNAYYAAIRQWEGGQHAALFRPQFVGERVPDTRRGLNGNLLFVDRHIAGARDAQEFYDVIRNFLVPIGIVCGKPAETPAAAA